MKKVLFMLFTILIMSSAKADYNGYHISFTIEKSGGKLSKGFVYVASVYLNQDSLKSTNYLKKALDQSFKEGGERDSLTYFAHRLKYEYRSVGSPEDSKTSTYTLKDKAVVAFDEIVSIKIDQMIQYGYLVGISSDLKLSDTTWTKKDPVKNVSYSGYLCYHQLLVHVNSDKIEAILKRLEAKQKEIDELDFNTDDGYKIGDKIDEELWEIVSELVGEKVVVISECTC